MPTFLTSMGRSWKAWATVARHIDGDTWIASEIDLGWGIKLHPMTGRPGPCAIRVTLPGGLPWDAPERRDPRGPSATDHLRGLLPIGVTTAIESYGFDHFGRTLAAVQLPDGRDLATVMAADGHTK